MKHNLIEGMLLLSIRENLNKFNAGSTCKKKAKIAQSPVASVTKM